MIGVRVGVCAGLRSGVAIGVSADELSAQSVISGVSRDATSLKYRPATLAQWSAVMAVAGVATGNPSSIYLLQEPTGNPADSAGAFPLTAAGTLVYLSPIAGWSTAGIMTTSGSAGTLTSTSASLPNIGTTSCAILAYVNMITGEATLRTVAQLGSSFNTVISAEINSAIKTMILQCDPNTATGVPDGTAGIRPIWITIDRTAVTATLETDLEALTAALTATPTGKQFMLGGDNTTSNFPTTATYNYAVRFDGSAAETTKAQRRAILQTLGWTIPW